VSYFRVFGCKCFILNKKPESSKFAPKIDEGFLLGYGPNEHAYRIFNNSSGRFEITVDVTFDKSNGSQVEQVDLDVVGKEESPCEAIKRLAIGDVRPVEANEDDEPQVQASTPIQGPTPISGPANLQDAEAPHQNAKAPGPGGFAPERGGSEVWGYNQQEDDQVQVNEPQADDVDEDQPLHEPFDVPPDLRVHQCIQRDHPVDNILGSIRRGVTTQSRLVNFCEFYSFISSLEPLKVEQALGDADWVMAM
jgi:hypothetical protein